MKKIQYSDNFSLNGVYGIMQEYQKEVMYTWRNELSRNEQLANVALGFAELGEILTIVYFGKGTAEDIIDECGDLMYYTAVFANLFNLDFAKLAEDSSLSGHISPDGFGFHLENYVSSIFHIQGIIKKMVFHDKPYDESTLQFDEFVKFLIGYVKAIGAYHGIELSKILQQNIDKLKQRHSRKDGEYKFQTNTN